MTAVARRDRLGERLRNGKGPVAGTLPVCVLLSSIDLIAPPPGIPATLLFIWLISWLSRRGWSDLGIRRPESWPKTFGIGIAVAFLIQALGTFVIAPVLQRLGVPLPDLSRFEEIQGNLTVLLVCLAPRYSRCWPERALNLLSPCLRGCAAPASSPGPSDSS